MKKTILAQRNSHNKIKFQNFYLDGATLSRDWGTLGGAEPQPTSNTFGYTNQGKSNEMPPEETALAAYNKVVAIKIKEGYQPVDSLDNAEALIPKLGNEQFDMASIPTGLCCSKPTASIPLEKLQALVDENAVSFFMKLNGLCHYVVIDPDKQVKIYTRRWDDHTRKYPAIVKYVESRNYPANSMFIAEFVVEPMMNIPHMEAFALMSSISKANVSGSKVKDDLTKTLTRLEKHPVRACVYGICYWDNKKVWHKSYRSQKPLLDERFGYITEEEDILFAPLEMYFGSAAAAIAWTKKFRKLHEGLVAWVMNEAMEMTFNGKPKLRAAYKIKDSAEMDVIASDYLEGTGKLQGKIGSLLIGLWNEAGEFVEMGKTGSGLKPKAGDNDIHRWKFPCVIEATYDQVFPTGKLQSPRFSKKHEDKLPMDCMTFEEHMKRAA